MAPDITKRLKPAAHTAAIRCYNQGLGDCFLLAFPRDEKPDDPAYVVIDCGVACGTPDEEKRMRQVVADIDAATGGHIDVLALTHQHYDHVIGFVHAKNLWDHITIERLYLPWTERPNDPDAETVGKAALRLTQAAHQAAEQTIWQAQSLNRTGPRLAGELLAAGSESFGARAAEGVALGWMYPLQRCSEEKRTYCEPGDVLSLPGTDVKVYVLGPPRPKNRDGKAVLNDKGRPLIFLLEDREEMYSYEQFGLTPDGAAGVSSAQGAALYANAATGETPSLASALLSSGPDGPDGDELYERYSPFDSSRRIDWDDALTLPFFRERYASDQDWRRIDDDWLGAASDLALRAGGFTNNLSLVLAFELPQSRKTLLFVGDAQVGNWLSWRHIGQWWPQNATLPSGPADTDSLLERVAFYKVGHHGSHNATIRDEGLEKMPDGLLAFIPVSVPVAHDIMGYCPMPYYPLLLALQQKTRGAVFLANGKLLQPTPEGTDPRQLELQLSSIVRTSDVMLDAKILHPGSTTEKALEDDVPLWTEFTLDDHSPT